MYNNLTDSELINITPTTELEAELMRRLDGSTEQDWDALHEQIEHNATQAREWEDVAERFRAALKKVATEIHRCADFGEIHITPEFRRHCDEVVHAMDEYVIYEYPVKANTSSLTQILTYEQIMSCHEGGMSLERFARNVERTTLAAINNRDLFRRLVDKAWNAATESQQVPSTKWADQIIDSIFKGVADL